jgi:hypothetical protein
MDIGLRKGVLKFAKGCWLGLTLLCLPALQAQTQAPPIQLQAVPLQLNGQPSGAEINVYVWRDRPATLYFVPTATFAAPLQCTIVAVNFPVNVTLKKPGDPGPASQALTLDLAINTPAPVTLTVEDLPQGDQFSGTLLITSKGNNPMSWRVNLKPPAGTLLVDPSMVNLAIMKPLFGSQSQLITVTVHEKTGKVGLDGVSARPGPVVKAPEKGFDLGQNVDFLFNGQEAPELTKWPPIQSSGPNRSISSNNGLATVGLRVKNLTAGEYNAAVQFQSINSINDDAKLILNLQVRHHWLWAVLVLVLAVAVSFITTKVISSLRQRFLFARRIGELRPAWLADEPKVLPVVWASAILKQSEDLSRTYWLTGEDEIEARVNQVAGVMAVLERVRVLRSQIKASSLPGFVRFRALTKLNQIVSSIGAGLQDDVVTKQLEAALDSLNQWLDATLWTKFYWGDLRLAVGHLLSEVTPKTVDDLETQASIQLAYDSLNDALRKDLQDEQAMLAIENQYANLKILWERRRYPERANLVKEKDTARIFQIADQAAWKRLKDNQTKIKIEAPQEDDIDSLQAYTPAQFNINPGDESLAQTFLFRHGLKFEWTFVVTLLGKRFRFKKRTMRLKPVTEEPQVIQYFPEKGAVQISVKIKYGDETIEISEPQEVSIAASSDFGTFRGLEAVEYMSFFAAAGAAILTGFTTLYLKNSGFGSLSDYLSLFAWGAGVDQTKNFIQNLQTRPK